MNTLEQLRRGDLAGATRLDLSADLETVPPEVLALADTLEVLNLTGNRLRELPADLGRLRRLRILFASDNAFTHLPESLGDCPALQVVGFKANRIERVDPSALPVALRWLILTDNALVALPDALGERPALQKLMLAGNRLTALPASLAHAQRLELLRLSANALTALPPWLLELPRLAWLALAGNPLGWQPRVGQALPALDWSGLRLDALLGEGASGHIHQVCRADGAALALKLFKGAVTSDGLPEDELAACLAARAHAALNTPVAVLQGHPEGTPGLLLPLLPPHLKSLADPPSLDSCTRDVYPAARRFAPAVASRLARDVSAATAHLHRQRVMHGDLYAHNTRFDPATGQAVLGDLGAATRLPVDRPDLALGLCRLEMRALGCLLEEVAERTEPGACQSRLARVAQDCLNPDPGARPTAEEVNDRLTDLGERDQ